MNATDTSIPNGLDRMNGLLAWWGMPSVADAGEFESQAKRCQALVVELNKLFLDATSGQTQALSEANEEFGRTLRDLLSAREPAELMSAQSRLATALMQTLATQTRAWADLSQQLYDCCMAVVGETATEAAKGAVSKAAAARSEGEGSTGEQGGTRAGRG